jgi:hypothetical protein
VRDNPTEFVSSVDSNRDGTICMSATELYDNKGPGPGGPPRGPEGCLVGDRVLTVRDNPNEFVNSYDANRDGVICKTDTGLYDNKGPGPGGPPRGREGCLAFDMVVTARDNPQEYQGVYDTNRDGIICTSDNINFYDNKGPGPSGPPRGHEGCLTGDRVLTTRDNPQEFQEVYDTNADGIICTGDNINFYDNKGH